LTVLLYGDHHGCHRRSQRRRICFPRCGMDWGKARWIRWLEGMCSETTGWPDEGRGSISVIACDKREAFAQGA